jgi:hypothetical protein
MHLVYIHGAKAGGHSFNYFRERITGHTDTVVEYNSDRGFFNNLADMTDLLKGKTDLVFIAHSLGGVYAVHLADRLKASTLGGISISTPYGGSESAVILQFLLMFAPQQLINDITPGAAPIQGAHKIKLLVPWTNLVTTAGHSLLMSEPNDGVVTRASMQCRKDIALIDVDRDHFDVMKSPEALKHIRMQLLKCSDHSAELALSA